MDAESIKALQKYWETLSNYKKFKFLLYNKKIFKSIIKGEKKEVD